MDKVKLFVAIPTTSTVADSQVYSLRAIEKKYGDRIEFVYPEKCVRRIFHDFARNALVDQFLATDCDIMWFLDSDICPPDNVLDLITEHGEKWKLAGAPYPVFMTPTGDKDCAVLMCVYKKGPHGLHITSVPNDGVEFVDGLATGCMFIKREAIEGMPKPYFEFKFDPETRLMTEGEDLGFCRKMSEKGLQFFIDYSMVCKHYKNVCLLEVNNYAINFANQKIKQFDAMVKSQVEALAQRYTALQRELVSTQAKLAEATKPKSRLILPENF